MARGVAVLAHHQAVTTRATIHLKRAVATELVARLLAEQLTPFCIRMFPPGSPSLKALQPTNPSVYIPEHMPPAEVENCRFEPPQSDDWMREHREISAQLPANARREANQWAAESMPARFAKLKAQRRSDLTVSEAAKSFYDLPKILAQVNAGLR
jgi:hypothetical protein